jgi:lipid-binding SYLF domain-containing protein
MIKGMKKIPVLLIVALIFGISTVAIAAKTDNYSSTIKVFQNSPVVAKFFKNSYGYSVFPTIGKAGYVIGGSYGKGQVYHRGKVTGKSTAIEGSIGFQAGAEAFSQIQLSDLKIPDTYRQEFSGTHLEWHMS